MRKNGDGSSPKSPDGVMSRSARSSFRALSNCLKVISSGASTVARSAVSAASSAVRDVDSHHDQVLYLLQFLETFGIVLLHLDDFDILKERSLCLLECLMSLG